MRSHQTHATKSKQQPHILRLCSLRSSLQSGMERSTRHDICVQRSVLRCKTGCASWRFRTTLSALTIARSRACAYVERQLMHQRAQGELTRDRQRTCGELSMMTVWRRSRPRTDRSFR